MLNYNSRMSVWMSTREVVANTFNRHDFAFAGLMPRWRHLWPAWATTGLSSKPRNAIEELVELTRPDIDVKAARKNNSIRELFDAPAFVPPP